MVHCDSVQSVPTAGQTSSFDRCMHSKIGEDIGEIPIERTASQALKKLKIDEIVTRISEMREPIEELGRTVSELRRSTEAVPESQGREELQQMAETAEKARKQVREFNEDLVEDMLRLDDLSGLAAEDRGGRKRTIAEIESLLGLVDACSGKVAGLSKHLETKLESPSLKDVVGDAAVVDDGASNASTDSVSNAHVRDRRDPAVVPSPGCLSSSCSQWADMLAPPRRELWQSVELPLQFRSREVQGGWEVFAFAPGLNAKDIKVKLGEDGSSVTLSGLRLPSEQQSRQMQSNLSALLQHKVRRSPSFLQQLHGQRLGELADTAYADMGRGKFGSFSQSFAVPRDADTSQLQASYRDGVLRVILPRTVRTWRPESVRRPFFDDRMWGW